MHNAQPRRLQSLALQFAEKAATMVDLNERALVMRTGGMRDTEDEGRGGNYGEGNFGSRRCVRSTSLSEGCTPFGSCGQRLWSWEERLGILLSCGHLSQTKDEGQEGTVYAGQIWLPKGTQGCILAWCCQAELAAPGGQGRGGLHVALGYCVWAAPQVHNATSQAVLVDSAWCAG